jgi:hypothetical protein
MLERVNVYFVTLRFIFTTRERFTLHAASAKL